MSLVPRRARLPAGNTSVSFGRAPFPPPTHTSASFDSEWYRGYFQKPMRLPHDCLHTVYIFPSLARCPDDTLEALRAATGRNEPKGGVEASTLGSDHKIPPRRILARVWVAPTPSFLLCPLALGFRRSPAAEISRRTWGVQRQAVGEGGLLEPPWAGERRVQSSPLREAGAQMSAADGGLRDTNKRATSHGCASFCTRRARKEKLATSRETEPVQGSLCRCRSCGLIFGGFWASCLRLARCAISLRQTSGQLRQIPSLMDVSHLTTLI